MSPQFLKSWVFAAVLLLLGSASGKPEQVTPAAPDPGTIEAWLQRLDEVAALYRDPALNFSCRETIAWTQTPGNSGRAKFDFLYAFNDRSGSLEDHRTLPREGSKQEFPEDVSPGEFGVPRLLRSGMLWPLIFLRSRWPQHHYALLGEETVLGRAAMRIHFDPIPPFQPDVNEWFGTAWVDRETGQFLRIEAFSPSSYRTWTHFQEYLAGGPSEGPYILERSDTDFGVERYGMRFPSRVWIEQAEYRAAGSRPTKHHKTTPLLTVEQTFDQYRFLGVRPEAEIK